MAILIEPKSGRRFVVPAHCTVGRDPQCTLRLEDHQVSQDHSVIYWSGENWEIRDLNSANGTWWNGEKIETDPVILVEGDELAFWKDGTPWQVATADPPEAMATRIDAPGVRVATNGLVAIPDGESPEVSIWQDELTRWVGERDGVTFRPRDGDIIAVNGSVWRLSLPHPRITTVRSDAPPLSIENLGLRFSVSRDEEYVRVEITGVDNPPEVPARACFYVLMVLARIRLDDIAAGYSEAECGWVGSERLAEMLKYEPGRINVDIYRARDCFGSLGIQNAPGLVERRSTVRELRLGVHNLEVRTLS